MEETLALPHINNLQTYVPGMPIETLAREKSLTKIIKLASNENPYGPSPKVLEAITKNLNSVNRYPDADMHSLRNALGEFYQLTPDMFVVGNGTDELLQMIMRVFVGTNNNIIAPRYSFSSYKISAAVINAQFIEPEINSDWTINPDNILASINKDTKLICLVNPNNPTGTYVDIKVIDRLLAKIPSNILVLFDEAYYEYLKFDKVLNPQTDPVDHSIQLLAKYKNLIITRTFSKAYGLAGLRAGYCIANPYIIALINKIKQPFNVNRLVQYAGVAALHDQEYLKTVVNHNTREKLHLYEAFDSLNIKYTRSGTNFIMLDAQTPEHSQAIYNHLLDNGIITRPVNSYDLARYLRITIGLPEENRALLDALKHYIVVC